MYYDETVASRAVEAASRILEWVHNNLKRFGVNV